MSLSDPNYGCMNCGEHGSDGEGNCVSCGEYYFAKKTKGKSREWKTTSDHPERCIGCEECAPDLVDWKKDNTNKEIPILKNNQKNINSMCGTVKIRGEHINKGLNNGILTLEPVWIIDQEGNKELLHFSIVMNNNEE